MMEQTVSQRVVVPTKTPLDENKRYSRLALFHEDGTPVTLGGTRGGTKGYTGEVVTESVTLVFQDGLLKSVSPL